MAIVYTSFDDPNRLTPGQREQADWRERNVYNVANQFSQAALQQNAIDHYLKGLQQQKQQQSDRDKYGGLIDMGTQAIAPAQEAISGAIGETGQWLGELGSQYGDEYQAMRDTALSQELRGEARAARERLPNIGEPRLDMPFRGGLEQLRQANPAREAAARAAQGAAEQATLTAEQDKLAGLNQIQEAVREGALENALRERSLLEFGSDWQGAQPAQLEMQRERHRRMAEEGRGDYPGMAPPDPMSAAMEAWASSRGTKDDWKDYDWLKNQYTHRRSAGLNTGEIEEALRRLAWEREWK